MINFYIYADRSLINIRMIKALHHRYQAVCIRDIQAGTREQGVALTTSSHKIIKKALCPRHPKALHHRHPSGMHWMTSSQHMNEALHHRHPSRLKLNHYQRELITLSIAFNDCTSNSNRRTYIYPPFHRHLSSTSN